MSKNYNYPDSLGDCGPTISEDDYNDMANWACMRDWYNDAINGDVFDGTFEEYVKSLQALCTVADGDA
jgi:hypothetical protein